MFFFKVGVVVFFILVLGLILGVIFRVGFSIKNSEE